MSHAPFDGVLLDDPREPIPGAVAVLLHLRVARRLAARSRRPAPGLDAVRARTQACQELLAHGLLPQALRDLQPFGLELGHPRTPRSLASLVEHLEAYLQEVDGSGRLDPDAALWAAVDRHLDGRRGFWVERSAADGPVQAGLRDLQPARLRALACLADLGGAEFTLATRKGDGCSGLFGSPQPLVDWFLEGLEAHGQDFPAALTLREPDGWGAAPWAETLDRLFEGPLDLQRHAQHFRRGLVEGPFDLLRHGVEQIRAWVDAGIPARDITVIHPAPDQVQALLGELLAAEGLTLHVRGGLLPLLRTAAWSPLWMLLSGVWRLDPYAVAAGLRPSQRGDLRRWAELLSAADQAGAAPFQDSFARLDGRLRPGPEVLWRRLESARAASRSGQEWADWIEDLAGTLDFPSDPDDFFAPLGLLKEALGSERWTYSDLLAGLQAFLESARSSSLPRPVDGVRLLAPGMLVDDWDGAAATLVLDLGEGAWPARPAVNPDLDWNRKADINKALLAKSRTGGHTFPPALQRFWLPRSEHGDGIPRAFQQEAYAFNKLLAMTRAQFVALSADQDAEGRRRSQGAFWTALDGAATWEPQVQRASSLLRWRWFGGDHDPRAEARAEVAQARPEEARNAVRAPAFDLAPRARELWMKGRAEASPTALEQLARCPFRSLAERGWGLRSLDFGAQRYMAVGSLVHRLLEAALAPLVGPGHWPATLLDRLGTTAEAAEPALLEHLSTLWEAGRVAWLEALPDIPREHWPQLVLELENLLPNLAAALQEDLSAGGPTKWEVAFLYPELLSMDAAEALRRAPPLQAGWTRELLAVEGDLGPLPLDHGMGRVLPMAGRIDRLERWTHLDGSSFLRVVDYKTSKTSSLSAYAAEGAPFGTHLQMPVYMLIAEAVHGSPATTVLLPLREDRPTAFAKHLQALGSHRGGWQERLRVVLGRLADRLDSGDFPPTPGESCAQCRLAALCGRPVDVATEEDGDD